MLIILASAHKRNIPCDAKHSRKTCPANVPILIAYPPNTKRVTESVLVSSNHGPLILTPLSSHVVRVPTVSFNMQVADDRSIIISTLIIVCQTNIVNGKQYTNCAHCLTIPIHIHCPVFAPPYLVSLLRNSTWWAFSKSFARVWGPPPYTTICSMRVISLRSTADSRRIDAGIVSSTFSGTWDSTGQMCTCGMQKNERLLHKSTREYVACTRSGPDVVCVITATTVVRGGRNYIVLHKNG